MPTSQIPLPILTRGKAAFYRRWWYERIEEMMWCKKCAQYFPGSSHVCPGEEMRRTLAIAGSFFEEMLARLKVGQYRYGPPDKGQKYMTRLGLELKEYLKTGNMEQLFNIANYAILESMAPEHPKFHKDFKTESVTRGKI